MKKSLFLCILLWFLGIGKPIAQNPYAELGKTAQILTLSNGMYPEVFPNDSIVRIGSVLFSTVTEKVVAFLPDDGDTGEMAESEVSNRFLSVDPIARQYPELTPYQFASNRPIDGVDLDGLEYTKAIVNGVTKIRFNTIVVDASHLSPNIKVIMAGIAKQYLETVSGRDISRLDPREITNGVPFSIDGQQYEIQFTYTVKSIKEITFDPDHMNDIKTLPNEYYTFFEDIPSSSKSQGGTTKGTDPMSSALFKIPVGVDGKLIDLTKPKKAADIYHTAVHEMLHPVLDHVWVKGSELYGYWEAGKKDILDGKYFPKDSKNIKILTDNIMNSEEASSPDGGMNTLLQTASGNNTMTDAQRIHLISTIPDH